MSDDLLLDEPVPTPSGDAPPPADVLLTDGSVAVVRPLRTSDRAAVAELHEKASDSSIRMRFFTASRRAGSAYVAHVFSGSARLALALVATVGDDLVAMGTAEQIDDHTAEIAFLVAETERGRGLGMLLLEHLAAAGHRSGIARFTADVLNENHRMLRVFTHAGFSVTRRSDGGVVTLEMDTATSAQSVARADERESGAEARSLAPLLRPATVAVLGARRDGTGTGGAVLSAIRHGGYTGRLYAVHPRASDLLGTTTHPRLVDVPEHVDLAVLAVPAARVLAAMEDAVAARVSCVVVISSGFAEMGPEGAVLQRDLQHLARAHGIRVVGPNCLGVMDNDPAVRLNATFTSVVPPPGGLAVASQSGGVGIAVLDLAQKIGLGIQSFVSLGNKADVSSNDLLSAWLHDPDVTAAALYLESFGNALKFARVAARFAELKPLLAVVGGRSAGGIRAGASHTAAAATPAIGVDALFAQAGVIACHDAHDLAHTALLLTEQPLPAGPRVVVISNAGGLGILAADAADRLGLQVPALSGDLRDRISSALTSTGGISNPVDLGAGVSPADFTAAMDPLLASDEVDAVVVLLVATSVFQHGSLIASLAASRAGGSDKPVLLVAYGEVDLEPIAGSGVSVFESAEIGLRSLAHASHYATWLRTSRGAERPSNPELAARARVLVHDLLAGSGDDGWLAPPEVSALLGPYGLAPVGTTHRGPEAAVAAAEALGYPAVLKAADPRIVHKSDRGLVRTDLRSSSEVRSAVDGFGAELGVRDVQVVVQPMLDGVEIALGMVRDHALGPMVMVAAGGVDIDIWDDRVFLLPPVTAQDAARALRSLRAWPLLQGHRGRPRAAVEAIEDHLVSLGHLAGDVPEIAELDLNPVLVSATGAYVVDAKVRLSAAKVLDAGVPRRLRPLA